MELVQGEGGVRPADPAFVAELSRFCKEREILFIVDEVSMMGDALMLSLLSAVAPGARVLLVGDTDQLPPVDAGLPLLAVAQAAPTVRLTRVYRQAAENPIIRAAHGLLQGQAPAWGDARLNLTETEPDGGAHGDLRRFSVGFGMCCPLRVGGYELAVADGGFVPVLVGGREVLELFTG